MKTKTFFYLIFPFFTFLFQFCTKNTVETKILEIEYLRRPSFNSLSDFFVKLEIKNNTTDTIFFLKEIEGEKNRYDLNNFEYSFFDTYSKNINSVDITLITKTDLKTIKPHTEITFWISFEPYIYSDANQVNSIPWIVDSLPNLKLCFCPTIHKNSNKVLYDTLFFEADTNTIIKEILIEPQSCP